MNNPKPDWLDWFGIRNLPDARQARWLGGLLSVSGALIVLGVFGLTTYEFFLALTGAGGFANATEQSEAIRNIGLVLAAIVGVPFIVWRTAVAHKQADTAAQALFNDKINAASDDLHAMRQRWDEDAKQNVWEPDIVRRNAAIDRLEGLVRERPEEAPRVSQTLSTYVRERSKEISPIALEDFEAEQSTQMWAHHDFVPATDMERAVRAVGQLKKIKGVRKSEVVIDLRGANLQGFDLSDFHQLKPDYTDGNFQGAHMQCINLGSATLNGAFLRYARMQGANLDRVQMASTQRRANLMYAKLQNAYFRGAMLPKALLSAGSLKNAIFDGATLSGAKIRHSDLRGTRFPDAVMRGVLLDGLTMDLNGLKMDEFTSFRGADLSGAAIRRASFLEPWSEKRYFPFSQEQIDGMFHDLSVNWPEFVQPGPHLQNSYMVEKDFIDAWHRWQHETGFMPSETT